MTHFEVIRDFFRHEEFELWGQIQADKGLFPAEQYGLQKYVKRPRFTIIIDIGTGGGRIALALAREGYHTVYGFDYLSEFIAEAQKRAQQYNLSIHFEVADARELPLQDKTVDVAVCWGEMLSALLTPAERKAALSEAYRVLRPNGLFFSSYNQFCSRWFNPLLQHYMKLVRVVTRYDLPSRALPMLRKQGQPNFRALFPCTGAAKAYWHRPSEAVHEILQTGFHVLEMYSSFGIQHLTHDYDASTKGRLHIVAQKPGQSWARPNH